MKNIYLPLAFVALSYLASGQKQTVKPHFNKALAKELDSIFIVDQSGRDKLQQLAINGIKDTASVIALAMKMNVTDMSNQERVNAILDKYGWLGPDVVGDSGTNALFFVIQHSGLTNQEKYLPMVREAVKNGKAKASELALLEDRVNIGENKKQIYGSQIVSNSTGGMEVAPIEDPDNVDKRRAQMGLDSMSDYCKNFNLIWDLERYKKGLALLTQDKK
ncbi:MAG TPA: DUF6624 domain-containing protein [Bacteroidia bacterium]|jgi:hypothetical protein|nr:DUF6624 domain-containing protein [Bacteroidia bacterium]